jgi:predicted dehydrogenase
MINWAIIGGGKVVETKSGPAFNQPGRSQIAAVIRRDPRHADETAKNLGAGFGITELKDAFSRSKIDAIYVATPPGLHYEQLLACLDYKVPVYVEKPITTTYAKALDLERRYHLATVPLLVAHPRRAWERFRLIKRLIDSWAPIDRFELVCYRRLKDDRFHPWLYNVSLSGGGKFFDIAPHYIDTIQYLLGPVTVRDRIVQTGLSPNGLEDHVRATLVTTSGAVGTVNFDLVANHKDDLMAIWAKNKSLHFPILAAGPVMIVESGRQTEMPWKAPILEQQDMIAEIINFLHHEPATICTASDALPVVKTIEEIYKGQLL